MARVVPATTGCGRRSRRTSPSGARSAPPCASPSTARPSSTCGAGWPIRRPPGHGSGTRWPSSGRARRARSRLCAHMLASRGELDLDAPVAKYWPEFGAAGKDEIPVRWLLTHQAGVAALDEPIPDGGLADWDLVVGRLAAQAPLWVPGTTPRLPRPDLRPPRRRGRPAGHRPVDRVVPPPTRSPVPATSTSGSGSPRSTTTGSPRTSAPSPTPPRRCPGFYEAALTDPTSLAHKVMMNSGGFLFPGRSTTRRSGPPRSPAPTASPTPAASPGSTSRSPVAARTWSASTHWPSWATSPPPSPSTP